MITMVQVSSTVGKSGTRIGIYKEESRIEITINGQTIIMVLRPHTAEDWDNAIISFKEAVARL